MRARGILAAALAVAAIGGSIAWLSDDDDPRPDRAAPIDAAPEDGDDDQGAGEAPAGDPPTSSTTPGRSRTGPDAPAPGDGAPGAVTVPGCTGAELCVGASKVSVAPDQRLIDGVEEPRLVLGTRLQRFNLGGFGINPLQGLPDPDASLSTRLTKPAAAPQFVGAHGPEPIWVRTMVVHEPGGETVALLTLDATGAGNVVQERLTEAVAEATGIPAANVLFGQTHTHAGPDLQGLWGGVPQDWIEDVLYPAAVRATQDALAGARPASLEVRSGPLPEHNRYRRPKRIDPDIDTDTRATLLRARDVWTGAVLGDLLQFNGHPTAVDEPIRVPHPDYILGALDWLERDGGVALYFNGPIADASSSGERPGCTAGDDGTYGEVRCRGEGIAAGTLAFRPRPVEGASLEVRHEEVLVPVTNPLFVAAGGLGAFNRYYDFLELPAAELPGIGDAVARGLIDLPQLTPTATTLVSRITIGGAEHGVELVTIPGEATGTFGVFIRGLAQPGADVVLLGLTQSSFGYIIPEEEFSYVDASGEAGFLSVPFTSYEEFVSLGPLTAPLSRAEGYVPLFDADPRQALPPVLTVCLDDLASEGCLLHVLGRHLAYVQAGLEAQCRSLGLLDAFCSLLAPGSVARG